jgi:hypothetical protein
LKHIFIQSTHFDLQIWFTKAHNLAKKM